MAHDIVIGSAPQPTSGHDIVMGDASSGGGSLLEMTIPVVSNTAVVVAAVLHDDEIFPSDTSWLRVVNAVGADDKFLSVYIHLGAGLVEGGTISFLSLVEQEMQGSLAAFSNMAFETIVEALEHINFNASDEIFAPAAESTDDNNTYLCFWFADDAVTWTAPTGFTTVETYSSSETDVRSLLVAYRVSRDVEDGEPGAAATSAPTSGRTWTLVLRYVAPVVVPLGHYWGPMFPDAGVATFTIEAVPASLALGSPLTAFDGALEHLIARARVAGLDGNDITLEFSDDALTTEGELEEDTTARTVHVKFVDGITTALDVVSLVASGSSLIEIVGTYNPSSVLVSGDDEFSATSLADGADARFGVLTRYWGPHFPDGAGDGVQIDPPAVDPIGPEAVATFALKLEAATVTFSWSTDVIKAYGGKEHRASLLDDPRQTYDGKALLLGGETVDVRNQLAKYAALGRPFLLGLTYEETVLTADADGLVVTVPDGATLDWANPGQRVIFLSGSGTHEAVIQSASGNEITMDTVDTAICVRGCRLFPAMAVLFEPTQTFSRYRSSAGAEIWQVKARAALFGFPLAATTAELAVSTPVTSSGALDHAIVRARTPGTAGNDITFSLTNDALVTEGELNEDTTALTVNAKFVGGTTTVKQLRDLLATGSSLVRLVGDGEGLDLNAAIDDDDEIPETLLAGGTDEQPGDMGRGVELTTFDSRAIWDRSVENRDTIDDGIHSLSELVDLGGLPIGIGAADVPDWRRRVALTGRLRSAQWQWLKLFLFTARGRWKSWWLPTYREDLVAISEGPDRGTEGDIIIDSTTGEYFLWESRGYFLLQIVQGSETYYAQINNANDNGDGTITLTVEIDTSDPAAEIPDAGAISRISWCERVRFEADDMTVQFSGAQFSFSADARVVQQ